MRFDLEESRFKESLKDKAELLKKPPRAKEQANPVEVLSKVDAFINYCLCFLTFNGQDPSVSISGTLDLMHQSLCIELCQW